MSRKARAQITITSVSDGEEYIIELSQESVVIASNATAGQLTGCQATFWKRTGSGAKTAVSMCCWVYARKGNSLTYIEAASKLSQSFSHTFSVSSAYLTTGYDAIVVCVYPTPGGLNADLSNCYAKREIAIVKHGDKGQKGEGGTDAVAYSLQCSPSAANFRRNALGEFQSHISVSCKIVKTVGAATSTVAQGAASGVYLWYRKLSGGAWSSVASATTSPAVSYDEASRDYSPVTGLEFALTKNNSAPGDSNVLARVTVPVMLDGNNGKDGADGSTGKSFYPAGQWNSMTTYTANQWECPLVWVDTGSGGRQWYYLPEGTSTNQDPRQAGTDGNPWKLAQNQWNVILTEAIFADFASFQSAVISGDWLLSKHGTYNGSIVDDNNATYTEGGVEQPCYMKFDPTDPNGEAADHFKPNFALDLKTGALYGSKIDISGTIRAENFFHNVCFFNGTTYSRPYYRYLGGMTKRYYQNFAVGQYYTHEQVVSLSGGQLRSDDPAGFEKSTGNADIIVTFLYGNANGVSLQMPSPDDYPGKVIQLYSYTIGNSTAEYYYAYGGLMTNAATSLYGDGTVEVYNPNSFSQVHVGGSVTYISTKLAQSINGHEYVWLLLENKTGGDVIINGDSSMSVAVTSVAGLTGSVTAEQLSNVLEDNGLASQEWVQQLGYALASQLPTVNNGKLTLQANGTAKATFTANQGGDTVLNIANGTTFGSIKVGGVDVVIGGASDIIRKVAMANGDDYDTLSGYTETRGSFVAYYASGSVNGTASNNISVTLANAANAYPTLLSYGHGNRTIQLMGHGWSDKLLYRHVETKAGTSNVWQLSEWKQIAFVSDIPSSLPASDVASWAKAAVKPTYTLDEIADGTGRKWSGLLQANGMTTDNDGRSDFFVRFPMSDEGDARMDVDFEGGASYNFDADVYVNNSLVATQGWLQSNYLPLTGGTLQPGAVIYLQETVNNRPVSSPVASRDWVQRQGYLTEHQSLAGYAMTSQLAGYQPKLKFVNTKVSGDQGTEASYVHMPLTSGSGHVYLDLSSYQTTIGDLATIRSNAANGQTAYGWGNHATAGYAKAADIPSTENFVTASDVATQLEAYAAISNGAIRIGDNSITPLTSYTEQYRGTVTQVKVGSTAYNPSSGVVSLPAYPTKASWNYDDVYLKLTGGTLTGNVNHKSGTLERGIAPSERVSLGRVWTDKDDKPLGRLELVSETAGSGIVANQNFIGLWVLGHVSGADSYGGLKIYKTKGETGNASMVFNANTGELAVVTLKMTAASGTSPMTVSSTTLVSNLNADLLDGKHASDFQPKLKFVNTKVSGDQGTEASYLHMPLTSGSGHVYLDLSGYQTSISDLATIRSNAANGQTAYGWGNHATAGYAKAADIPSTENFVTASDVATQLGSYAAISNGTIRIGDNSIKPLTSYTEQYRGTVTQVKVGSTAYNPSSGVVSLPAYPTKASWNYDDVYLPLTGGTLTGNVNHKSGTLERGVAPSERVSLGRAWTDKNDKQLGRLELVSETAGSGSVANQNFIGLWVLGHVSGADSYGGLKIYKTKGETGNASMVFNANTGELAVVTLKMTAASGTSPMTVSSTTLVSNLNADLLDGKHASDFQQKLSFIDTKNGNGTIDGGTVGAIAFPLTKSVDGKLTLDLSGYATQSWVESQGYLTEHQSLAGYATTSQLAGYQPKLKFVNTKVSGDQGTEASHIHMPLTSGSGHVYLDLSGYQTTISDLATIRSNAANGQTAYGWGNHASAGYAKLSDVPSTENFVTAADVATQLEAYAAISNGTIRIGDNSITPLTSYTEQYRGTVTQVKVGSTAYNPSSGVVSLPAYPATVAKLTTARTLWGQNFDGSGNVDGKMIINYTGSSAAELITLKTTNSSYNCISYGKVNSNGNSWSAGINQNAYYLWNSSKSTVFSVLNNGNVGIGTTSPAYKLDVNGTAAVNSKLIINGGQVTNDSKGIQINASDNSKRALFVYNGNTTSIDNAYLKIEANLGHIALMPGGNVGIGTTSPAYKLDVNGTARFTGFITAGAGIGGTSADFDSLSKGGVSVATLNDIPSTADFVTIDGSQTIDGVKTFGNNVIVASGKELILGGGGASMKGDAVGYVSLGGQGFNFVTSVLTKNNVALATVDDLPLAQHNATGTAGTAGWVKIATITIGGTYKNQPLKFLMTQRGGYSSELTLTFTNSSTAAGHGVGSLTYTGSLTDAVISVPTANGTADTTTGTTWNLYVKKSEAYDNIGISLLNKGSYMDVVKVSWRNDHVTEPPKNTSTGQYFGKTATKSNALGESFVTSTKSGLSNWWVKAWDMSLTTQKNVEQRMEFDVEYGLGTTYQYGRVLIVLKQTGNNSQTGSSINYSISRAAFKLEYGNLNTARLRLYTNNTTGKCELWVNVGGLNGYYNFTLVKSVAGSGNLSRQIGTWYNIDFQTAQTLPTTNYTYTELTYMGTVAGTVTLDSVLFGGNVSVGVTTNSRSVPELHVEGNRTSFDGFHFDYGSVFVNNGSVTATNFINSSDARRKDVDRYLEPSVYAVAHAPLVAFRWKGGDGRENVGTIAQYWQGVLPQAVHQDTDGMLSLEYQTVALTAGIAAARKAVDNERRIMELENEVVQLKRQIADLTSN